MKSRKIKDQNGYYAVVTMRFFDRLVISVRRKREPGSCSLVLGGQHIPFSIGIKSKPVCRLCLFLTVKLANCRQVRRRHRCCYACTSPHINFKALIRRHTLPPLILFRAGVERSVFPSQGQKRGFLRCQPLAQPATV